MYIDTHLHLSKQYYDNIDEVIKLAHDKDVNTLIVSCCDKEGIKEALFYMNQYSNVYYTFGYHPSEVNEVTNQDLIELSQIIQTNDKIVGIGEIGLDYHYEKDNKEAQKKIFEEQLKFAEKLKLPVVIHSREATEDTINILKKYPTVKGVIHCFSGSLETAKQYIDMGYVLGIGGVLTFQNSKLKEVIKYVPLHKLILETDSPYLSPVPVRGTKNMPSNIPYIANYLATIKEVSTKEIGYITTKTAIDVFDLPSE